MTAKQPGSKGRSTRGTTLVDVARLAGVAPMTVSRYLNAPDAVREQTRLKIQQAIVQTGYVQNRLASSLASNRSRLVAVVLPMVTNPLFSDTFQAINERLTQAGYQVLLGVSGYQSEQEQQLLDVILSRRPDGIILTGTLHTQASRERLRAAAVPVVETWDLTDDPIDMLVGFSHERVGSDVAQRLLRLGYRRFALLTVDDPRGLRRARSLLDALAQAGIGDVQQQIFAGLPTLEQGRRGLDTLLEHDRPTPQTPPLMVVCTSDTLAHGVLTEAAARGLPVPERLGVMGFGDMNFASHTFPALSTVRIDGAHLGACAADLLLRRLQQFEQVDGIVDIGFSLIERQTTRAVP